MVRSAKTKKNKSEAENGGTDEVKSLNEDTNTQEETVSNEEVEKVEPEATEVTKKGASKNKSKTNDAEDQTEDEETKESTSEPAESKEAESEVKAGKRKSRPSTANSKKTKVSDEVTENKAERKRGKSVTKEVPSERRTSKRSESSVGTDMKKRKTSNKENEQSDEDYEVLKIVDMRQKKGGKKEFLIRWKGFSAKDDSWEPEEHLDCKSLITSFLESNKAAQDGSPKSIKKKEVKKKEEKNETNYEVEKIINFKEKGGKKEFLVRWKGYKPKDDSWVPEGDMSCTLLIEEFMEKSKDATAKAVVTKSGRSVRAKK